MDTTKIIAYENGEMDEDEEVAFFQDLVDTGLAWQLQGRYGRQAAYLIECGLVSPPTVTPNPSTEPNATERTRT